MSRRGLLAFAAAALAAAVLLAVSGGFRVTVGGLRVSATSPLTPALIASFAAGAWAWLAARSGHTARDLAEVWPAIQRVASTVVLGVGVASAGTAIAFGTYSAAGADASGYLSQAAMWAAGRLRIADALLFLPGWPPDVSITAPLGWTPALEVGWQVPTYGPGLPLLMAFPYAVGGSLGASLVVPFSALIVVVTSSAIAFEMAGAVAAVVTAVALSTTPVLLIQSFQPMSDVPVTAAWMTAWWLLIAAGGRRQTGGGRRQTADGRRQTIDRRRAALAGLASAIAILIRPNLAPLAVAPLAFVFAQGERRLAKSVRFAVPVALAGFLLSWLQWTWYGSPIKSGYGAVEELYAWINVAPNLSRYAAWLAWTSPVLLVSLAGVWARRHLTITWALVVFGALNAAAYLAYFVFDDWTYLRFLLPALAVGAVFTGVAVDAVASRFPLPARGPIVFFLLLLLAAAGLWRARALNAFNVAETHRRVLHIDRYLDSALPPGAVVIAGEHSGAVRFDTGHDIIRWEATPREHFRRALEALEAHRREVWILLDAWEEPLVREKFSGIAAAQLDWPPAAVAGDLPRTRAWRLADRERYLEGERVITDRLR